MAGERRRLGRRQARLRRALRLVLPLVLSAVVVALVAGAISQIGPASGAYRRSLDRSYAALLGPIAAASNQSGAQARALLSGAAGVDRVTLFTRLDALAADTSDQLRRLGAVSSPAPASAAAALCRRALEQRAGAASHLRSSLERLLGGRTGLGSPDPGAAATGVTDAVVAMQAGDASWAGCRRGLRRGPGSAHLAASVWLRNGGGLSARGVVDLVAAVGGSASLAAVHRLAVLAVVTAPPAVVSGTTLVVVPSTRLAVSAVVANQGNVDEDGVEIGGAAQLLGGPASPPTAQRTLDLSAGTSISLTLPGFGVSPGSSYTVVVTAESPRAEGTGPIATRSLEVEVQPAATESVVTAPGRVVAGRSVTLDVTVTSALGGIGDPTGTVAFQDDGTTLAGCGAQSLHDGQATCTTSFPGPGARTIGAVYGGTDRFATSTSAAVTLQVGPG